MADSLFQRPRPTTGRTPCCFTFWRFLPAMMFWLAAHPRLGPGAPPPFAFFGIFGVLWFSGMAGWARNVILAIVYGIKANQGEWARFPILGNFVLRRILPYQGFS